MDKYSISTGTVTYALRGRDALRYYGYKAYVERSSAGDALGCGYSIIVSGDIDKITEILKQKSVKVLKLEKL